MTPAHDSAPLERDEVEALQFLGRWEREHGYQSAELRVVRGAITSRTRSVDELVRALIERGLVERAGSAPTHDRLIILTAEGLLHEASGISASVVSLAEPSRVSSGNMRSSPNFISSIGSG